MTIREDRRLKMVTRRQGREWALQLLVQFDLNPPLMAENDIPVFWELQTELEAEARAEEEGVKTVKNPTMSRKYSSRHFSLCSS